MNIHLTLPVSEWLALHEVLQREGASFPISLSRVMQIHTPVDSSYIEFNVQIRREVVPMFGHRARSTTAKA